jgi:hypothetical protein
MDWSVLLHLPATAPVDMTKHAIPPALYWSLEALQGVAWIYAYVMVIRCGMLDRFVGMPLVALGLNLGWELTYAFVLPNPPTQKVVNIAWVALDGVILGQALAYGRRDHPTLTRADLWLAVWGWVAVATAFQIALGHDLADRYGIYGGLGINPVMSFAFIGMLRRRGSSAGQSMHIAVSKCAGSLAAGAMFVAMFPDRWLLSLCTLVSLVLDIAYIRLLRRRILAEGQPVWRLAHGRSTGLPAPRPAVPVTVAAG